MTTFSLAIGLLLIFGMILTAAPSLPQGRDATLKLTLALPSSTTAVTSVAAVDVGKTIAGLKQNRIECLITAPALNTSQLPDAKTMTYKLIQSDNLDLSSPSDVYSTNLIVQTGAGGAGAVGATKRVRLPSDVKQYVGLVATPSGSGAGDASAVSATMEIVF